MGMHFLWLFSMFESCGNHCNSILVRVRSQIICADACWDGPGSAPIEPVITPDLSDGKDIHLGPGLSIEYPLDTTVPKSRYVQEPFIRTRCSGGPTENHHDDHYAYMHLCVV